MSSVTPNKESKVEMGITSRKTDLTNVANEIQALGRHVHPPVPNPAPLGLFAFGLTTALLQMRHTRISGDNDEDVEGTTLVVLGFAMFFGGLLQVIAGLSEIRRNNIFGYTAFLLYGGFWMSVSTIYIISFIATGEEPSVNEKVMQAMLFLVGLYTLVLFICTLKMNKTISLLFLLLMTTCFLLSGGVRNETVDKIGGWFGLATSTVAYWLASAELINDINGEGKEIIPLGQWRKNRFQSSGGAHRPGLVHGTRLSMVLPRPDGSTENAAYISSLPKAAEDIEVGEA